MQTTGPHREHAPNASPAPCGSWKAASNQAHYRGGQRLWEDGHRSDFDVRDLRLACHYAFCAEEMSGRSLLDPKNVRPDASPRTITSVGTRRRSWTSSTRRITHRARIPFYERTG